ncbi:MAG: hypothetical protein LBP54_08265 [Campylobacteraceae bacterium]|jgi:hypothetical protein|nr:hypothetical protein [Campylobacteraceae bacterium]
MIAFQIALIIEYMQNKFDIKLFEESLKKKSFYPFVELISANDLACKHYEWLKILKDRYDDCSHNDTVEKINKEIKKP